MFNPAASLTLERLDQASVSRVRLDGGGLLYVRSNGVIDAIGVEHGYEDMLCGAFRLGDEVSAIFLGDKETPRFGGEFVEIADFVLYFRSHELGLSVHLMDPIVEDGPCDGAEWERVLRCHIGSVVVAKHADRLAAY